MPRLDDSGTCLFRLPVRKDRQAAWNAIDAGRRPEGIFPIDSVKQHRMRTSGIRHEERRLDRSFSAEGRHGTGCTLRGSHAVRMKLMRRNRIKLSNARGFYFGQEG